ncbi:MAG TPA: ribonuclease HI [Anaerolineales bacterium]|nr:ribonuclease HI [Anaerolineales bacterium]
MSEKSEVHIYTDGGCVPNPGLGAWATILVAGINEKTLSGVEPDSTNNRMELRAALAGLQALKRPCRVVLYTDSQYMQRGITEWIHKWRKNGWLTAKKEPVANADLWRELWDALQTHEVRWQWVRGHAGDHYNERCDQLTHAARQTYLRTRNR